MDGMGAVEGNASIASASQNNCDGDTQDNSIQDNANSTVELIKPQPSDISKGTALAQ
jgi:hypothetical protein